MATFGVLVLPRLEAPREVKLLEEMGFDIALIPDSQAFIREVYVTLTTCAVNTNKIMLGPGITKTLSCRGLLILVMTSGAGVLREISGIKRLVAGEKLLE